MVVWSDSLIGWCGGGGVNQGLRYPSARDRAPRIIAYPMD